MYDLAALVLRLGLGIMFVAHGLQMAAGIFGGPGIGGFSSMLSGLKFFAPTFWAYVGAYSILICGLLLIVGLFVRTACIPLAIFIIVAGVSVHLSKGFFMMNGGYEYNFVILTGLIALMLLGGGKIRIMK